MVLLKKSLMTAAAVAMTLGSVAPASAGGYHGHGGYHRGHYAGHYGHGYRPHYYYGSHYYRHRHGLSGGEAALLTVGILGGIVLIDRALEADRASNAYYYDNSYPPPPPAPNDDFYYRRDYRDPPPPPAYQPDDALDGQLLGGGNGETRANYNYGAAYNDCKAETRQAATDGGLIISLPAKPQRITPVDDGAAVRFEADFVASNLRSQSGEIRRTMVCEADAGGVRFLQLT